MEKKIQLKFTVYIMIIKFVVLCTLQTATIGVEGWTVSRVNMARSKST